MSAFLVMPVFVVLVLYVFSVGREIWLIQKDRQVSLLKYHEDNCAPSDFELTSENNTEMVVKVFRGSGKEIKMDEEEVERSI